MILAETVAAAFLLLTGPDNQPIEINPAAITTLRPPLHREHFAKGIRCIVHTDGQFVTVKESCSEIKEMVK